MDRTEVVVGIDGSRAALQALRWAAAEAGYRNVGLTIAHAGDVERDRDGTIRPTEFCRSLMADAQAEVFDTGFDGPVHVVSTGDAAAALLIEESAGAGLIVVGSHGLGQSAAALVGSVAFRVAGHAECPVAVIPQGWDPAPFAGSGEIAVGIGWTSGARAALGYAFAEAERRDLSIRAVRSYFRPDWGTSPAPNLYLTAESYEESQQARVEAELAPLRRAHPDVPVNVTITGRPIPETMALQSRTAELLVTGSRLADGRRYSRLGPTSGRLLHDAHCPVIVVGHPAAARLTGTSAAVSGR